MTAFFQFELFKSVIHGITQRGNTNKKYGGFNLAEHTGDDLNNVIENRSQLANKLAIDATQLIFANQTHSNNVAQVESTQVNPILNADALITNRKGICLNILTADCVPILIYDPVNKCTGAIHAGWRGTAGSIVKNTIKSMSMNYGSQPENVLVGIGPCISKESYEVGGEVARNFSDDCSKIQFNGKYKLDLVKANVNQLLEVGVDENRIEIAGICTYQSKNYYSARREGLNSGRFSSFLLL